MASQKLESHDICAVIVTYHPDTQFQQRLAAITRQVGKVIIVDNGSSQRAITMLQEICQNSAVELILNEANFGIAKALNIGISHAKQQGYLWAILFDQDSTAHNDLAISLCHIYSVHPSPDQIALIGANYKNILKNMQNKSTCQSESADEWSEVKRVITSGSLLSLPIYDKIGRFRDDFFIDLVDIEYCMRARRMGYQVIKSSKFLMSHSIGFPSQHRLLGRIIWTTNHAPIRRYYYARNYVAIQREYGNYIFAWWAIKSLKKSIRLSTIILLFEQNKLAKISAIAKGWWHGMSNQMGKYEL
ncbi:MAG: glycosyltransferase family 2 protein [Candidatus Methylopumilus sp.]|jgi:rhamnosyltransferase